MTNVSIELKAMVKSIATQTTSAWIKEQKLNTVTPKFGCFGNVNVKIKETDATVSQMVNTIIGSTAMAVTIDGVTIDNLIAAYTRALAEVAYEIGLWRTDWENVEGFLNSITKEIAKMIPEKDTHISDNERNVVRGTYAPILNTLGRIKTTWPEDPRALKDIIDCAMAEIDEMIGLIREEAELKPSLASAMFEINESAFKNRCAINKRRMIDSNVNCLRFTGGRLVVITNQNQRNFAALYRMQPGDFKDILGVMLSTPIDDQSYSRVVDICIQAIVSDYVQMISTSNFNNVIFNCLTDGCIHEVISSYLNV